MEMRTVVQEAAGTRGLADRLTAVLRVLESVGHRMVARWAPVETWQ